jgi:hypothetical protein
LGRDHRCDLFQGKIWAKGVWLVNSNGHPTLLSVLNTLHLEGVVTIPTALTNLGPWAGKIVTGDEDAVDENEQPQPLIYTIDTNGVVSSFASGIHPEDFDIIPNDVTNQNLYCVSPGGDILKLSGSLFANYIGDLLVTQAGEGGAEPRLFIVHWDGTEFVIRTIYDISILHYEHVTFAPIDIPGS